MPRSAMMGELKALNGRHAKLEGFLEVFSRVMLTHPSRGSSNDRYLQSSYLHSCVSSDDTQQLKAAILPELHDAATLEAKFDAWTKQFKGKLRSRNDKDRAQRISDLKKEAALQSSASHFLLPDNVDLVLMMEESLCAGDITTATTTSMDWSSIALQDVTRFFTAYSECTLNAQVVCNAECRCGGSDGSDYGYDWDYGCGDDCECYHECGYYDWGYQFFNFWAHKKFSVKRIQGLMDVSVCGALVYMMHVVTPLMEVQWLDYKDGSDHAEAAGSAECWGDDVAKTLCDALEDSTTLAVRAWSAAADRDASIRACKWWLYALSSKNEEADRDAGDCPYAECIHICREWMRIGAVPVLKQRQSLPRGG